MCATKFGNLDRLKIVIMKLLLTLDVNKYLIQLFLLSPIYPDLMKQKMLKKRHESVILIFTIFSKEIKYFRKR